MQIHPQTSANNPKKKKKKINKFLEIDAKNSLSKQKEKKNVFKIFA
jgi:hypothetical protein